MKAAPFDINFIGKKYGMITILYGGGIKEGRRMVTGRCDCGIEKEYKLSSLTRGNTTTCGCMRKKTCAKNFTTHNLSKHPLYMIWKGIKRRCYNENNDHFKYYGGKGVTMCDEWKTDFIPFYNWALNNGWKKGLDIDKDIIPNKLGIPAIIYSPEMCCFVTRKKNCDNKTTSIPYYLDGIKYTLTELCEKHNLKYKALFARIKLGWSIEEAVFLPKNYRNRTKEIALKNTI